jgi:hypothetical protein
VRLSRTTESSTDKRIASKTPGTLGRAAEPQRRAADLLAFLA